MFSLIIHLLKHHIVLIDIKTGCIKKETCLRKGFMLSILNEMQMTFTMWLLTNRYHPFLLNHLLALTKKDKSFCSLRIQNALKCRRKQSLAGGKVKYAGHDSLK